MEVAGWRNVAHAVAGAGRLVKGLTVLSCSTTTTNECRESLH